MNPMCRTNKSGLFNCDLLIVDCIIAFNHSFYVYCTMNRKQKKSSHSTSSISSEDAHPVRPKKPKSITEQFAADLFRIFGKSMYAICLLSLFYFSYYAYQTFTGAGKPPKSHPVSLTLIFFDGIAHLVIETSSKKGDRRDKSLSICTFL